MEELKIGEVYVKEEIVTEERLAVRIGSGDVAVYATPAMLALMEGAAAALLAQHLEERMTSVGSFIGASHIAPTPVGMKVRAEAAVTGIEGRKVFFKVSAFDEAGLIGEGTHERFILSREKFEAKALAKKTE